MGKFLSLMVVSGMLVAVSGCGSAVAEMTAVPEPVKTVPAVAPVAPVTPAVPAPTPVESVTKSAATSLTLTDVKDSSLFHHDMVVATKRYAVVVTKVDDTWRGAMTTTITVPCDVTFGLRLETCVYDALTKTWVAKTTGPKIVTVAPVLSEMQVSSTYSGWGRIGFWDNDYEKELADEAAKTVHAEAAAIAQKDLDQTVTMIESIKRGRGQIARQLASMISTFDATALVKVD